MKQHFSMWVFSKISLFDRVGVQNFLYFSHFLLFSGYTILRVEPYLTSTASLPFYNFLMTLFLTYIVFWCAIRWISARSYCLSFRLLSAQVAHRILGSVIIYVSPRECRICYTLCPQFGVVVRKCILCSRKPSSLDLECCPISRFPYLE